MALLISFMDYTSCFILETSAQAYIGLTFEWMVKSEITSILELEITSKKFQDLPEMHKRHQNMNFGENWSEN